MNQPDILQQLNHWQENWETDLGGWIPGERVILRNKDLFKEFSSASWMDLLLYAITGRQFSPNQLKLFETIWVISTSFPDPRLWNNRVAALAGNARSTVNLGLSAGIATSEATIYGHRPLIASISFLKNIQRGLEKGKQLTNLITEVLHAKPEGKPGSGEEREVAIIPGFGRPITSKDERLAPLLEATNKLGFSDGIYVSLAQRIEKVLQKHGHELYMNVATLMGALCADQGLTTREYYHYVTLCFSAGLLPCAIDAQTKPEGAFFPIRCDQINYLGPAKRRWHQESAN